MRLDHLKISVPIKISVVHLQRFGAVALIFCVAAPVGGDNVQPAIFIEITGRHPIPPSRVRAKAPSVRHISKYSTVILKKADRSPFAGQDQINISIAIDIAEQSCADQANVFQELVVAGIRHEVAMVIAKNPRAGGRWIFA